MVLSASALWAQNPTTTYPYLYDHFIDGTVVIEGGAKESRQMNIHLRRGALHYIENGVVREALLANVLAVEIGTDVFLPSEARMYKVVAKSSNGSIVEEILGDFEAAMATEGAYGVSSTTSATMKLSSIQTDAQVNQNYMNILNERELGRNLPIVSSLWIISPSFKVKATKKDVTAMLPQENVGKWKAFQKKHKIKWKNPAHLLTVLDWLATL